MIFHLDLDTFFVSVERILDNSLEGKPVIVGADPQGRGVVSACSYEARSFGVRSGMPIKQAYKLCPKGIYLHGHGKEYIRYSELVGNLLEKYAPIIEKASIDECYMDFSGCEKVYGNLFLFAQKIQRKIFQELLLPCSIGIGGNKTIAKICSDFCKPMGVAYVPKGVEKEFLASLPVEVIPGVGKVMLKELNSRGIILVSDLTKLPSDYLSMTYGKIGTDLWNKANGRGTDFLSVEHSRKSISKETTFENDVLDKTILENVLSNLAAKVCYTLRKNEWLASTISLKLRYSDFITYTRSKTISPTDDEKIVYETVLKLFNTANTRRVAVRLLGVGLTNFIPFFFQDILFKTDKSKRENMLNAVDSLKRKYGYSIINYANANLHY